MWVNEADARRIATHLHIKEADFLRKYTKKYTRKTGWWLLRSTGQNQALPFFCARSLSLSAWPDVPAVCCCAQDCIFLGKNNACSVHACKPLQCTTYPWWCAPKVPASCLFTKGALLCMVLFQLVCHMMEYSLEQFCGHAQAGPHG